MPNEEEHSPCLYEWERILVGKGECGLPSMQYMVRYWEHQIGIQALQHRNTHTQINYKTHILYMNIHIYVSCTEHQLVIQVTNQLQHSKHTSLSPLSYVGTIGLRLITVNKRMEYQQNSNPDIFLIFFIMKTNP